MPRGDCLDQLDASHDRQVRALASLVAGARELEVNAHEVRAVEWGTDEVGAALAFWQRAVERHFADEELSLFPRLAARRPDLAAEIERVVAEHATHRALARAVADDFAHWEQTRAVGDAAALRAAIAELDAAHQAHVRAEEPLITAARAALTGPDLAEAAAEMDARRPA